MKRMVALFLTLCLILMSGVVLAQTETPVFTFCISHMTNAFTVTAAEAMTAAAEAAGAKMTVVEAAQDINKQVSQIEMAVNTSDVIIIEPVSTDGVLAAVSAAMEAGVPVVIFNQAISDPSRASTFCGVSNADLGYMQMKRAIEDMGGSGSVALLLGPLGSDGQLGRSAGYKRAIDETNGAVTIAFEETANWTTEEALVLAENWLQTGIEIDAFVCQNDGMAMGAVKATEDKNLKIKCYGLDATDDALRAVKEGRLELSVSQNTEAQAQASVDSAMKLWAGEEVPSEILAEGLIIDASNVDEFLK
ncbi:MAG: sugar ABC transporter substrate-binding protein [Eubacteriales bacterium]|nr:sugar ABC transporter substrate-binding protein [Eubacteriales bacterium]